MVTAMTRKTLVCYRVANRPVWKGLSGVASIAPVPLGRLSSGRKLRNQYSTRNSISCLCTSTRSLEQCSVGNDRYYAQTVHVDIAIAIPISHARLAKSARVAPPPVSNFERVLVSSYLRTSSSRLHTHIRHQTSGIRRQVSGVRRAFLVHR